LGTGRELQDFPAMIIIGRAVQKETGAPTIPPPAWRLGGVGGEDKRHLNGAVNPTSELTVMGWQVNTYLALQAEMEHWASRFGGPGSSNKLMVLHSGGDTLAGGCTEQELQDRYDALIQAAGGTQTIVFAAEVSPFPADLGWSYNLSSSSWAEERRTNTLTALGIPEDWASLYANCTNGPCGPTMKYQYANSGFIMGPVDDLITMFKEFEKYTSWTNRHINDYFLQNGDKVTLDYGGTLALTLNNMGNADFPVFFARSMSGSSMLRRKGTFAPICFVHGNGNGFDKLKSMAEAILTPVS